jgi:hypothetical protein
VANFSIAEYRQAIAGAVTGMVLAFFGMDGYRGVVHTRNDPLTDKDGKLLRLEVMRDCVAYTNAVFEAHSETTMPPFKTRQRTIHIEDFIHDMHPEFRRKSNEW